MPSSVPTLTLSASHDLIDFGDFMHILRRRWRRIAVFAAITTVIAAYSVLSSRPQFTLNGAIYLGDAQGSGAQGSGDTSFLSDYQDNSGVDTQLQLIQSKALIEQAVLETGLNASVTPAGRKPMPFWRWRFLHGEAIQAFAPQPGDLVAQFASLSDPGSRGAAFTLRMGAAGHYQLLQGGSWLKSAHPVISGVLNQPASGGGLSLLLKSALPGVMPAAGRIYTLSVAPAKAVADQLLGRALSVTAGGAATAPTQLASVQLLWANPYAGQAFVNQLMQDYIATQLSWKTQSASNTEQFIADQLNNVRAAMVNADQKLADYQAKTGILDVPGNAQADISQLSQYEVQRTGLLLQQQALQQLVTATEHPENGVNPYLVSQVNDPVLSGLAANLANAEVQLAGQEVQYTSLAPETQVQAATVAKIEGAMRALIANDESQATKNLSNIDQLIKTYQHQLQSAPAESLQVIALTRSSNVFGQLYVLLMQKEEEAEVSKAATIVNTRIVTPVEVPLYATKPKGAITLLAGLVFGLFAGMLSVLAQRALSEKIQSDDEIRRALPFRIYGLIPEREREDGAKPVFQNRLQSPFSQAFRLVRSNLYQADSEGGSQVILLTSPGLGDGKTTISCNLAKMLADDGKRVILIDADLHQGRMHDVLGLAQAPGLAEWLKTKSPPALQFLPQQHLAVLTSGNFPLNPSELLNSKALPELLSKLRAEFDFIIIDCPPLPIVSDTLSLVKYADLILSVVYLDHTSRRGFVLHNDAIRAAARRRGIIVNGVTKTPRQTYGYGHGYGYGAQPRGIARITQMLRDAASLRDPHG